MAPKDDSNISSAELVYGALWSCPANSWTPPSRPPPNSWSTCGPYLLPYLRDPFPPKPQRTLEQLLQASWVYVRRGGTTPPLTPPYAGPYEVLESGEKTFLIRIGDKEDRVSV